MTTTDTQTFHIDIGLRRAWLLIIPVVLLLIILWPYYLAAVLLALQIGLILALLAYVGTVSVHAHGLMLYRINRLVWSDIKAVQHRELFGLPYLRITRHKRLTGNWLPLYLKDERAFYAAIVAQAPAGNPLREYAETMQKPAQTAAGNRASAPTHPET